MAPRKRTTKSKTPARGDCYEAAGRYMMDMCLFNPQSNLILVHGEVAGQGPLEGVTFGHGWVLDGDMVIDKSNGKDLRLPKALYYNAGQIDRIGNLHMYTWEEARKKILQHNHWGPWDLKTATGL